MIQSINWPNYSPSMSLTPDAGSKMDKGQIYSEFTIYSLNNKKKKPNKTRSHPVFLTLFPVFGNSVPQKDLCFNDEPDW